MKDGPTANSAWRWKTSAITTRRQANYQPTFTPAARGKVPPTLRRGNRGERKVKDEKPSIVSVSDMDGNVIIDRMSIDEKLRRFDSHRVAHRKMAMAKKKRDIPESGPPAQYDIYDFDDLGVAKGLIFAAALAAIVAFIVLFF